MTNPARVLVDPSQFPGRVREDLLESLRSRRIHGKFHYDSYKQARQWLRLHEAYSPARREPGCAAIYDRALEGAARLFSGRRVHAIGLGAGGGWKEARLLGFLRGHGAEVFYTPADASVALALVSREAALPIVGEHACNPLVTDLASAEGLAGALEAAGPDWGGSAARLVTLFGLLPNLEPAAVPRLLEAAVPLRGRVLLSANLAPGDDYSAGVERVLPLYDNDLTRGWLMTFLLDLGIESGDGNIRFEVEEAGRHGMKRIVAWFDFLRLRTLQVETEEFRFEPGDTIRLFISNRHTPGMVESVLGECGLGLEEQWVSASGEEGVFLAVRG